METDSYQYWKQIWVEPRETIHRIIHLNPNKGLWWLSSIYGFSMMINGLLPFMAEGQVPVWQAYLLALILSPICGFIVISVWSALVSFAGKIFGGAGSYKEIRAAYSWSCLPYIVNVVLWISFALLLGRQFFLNLTHQQNMPPFEVAILFAFFILRFGAWIWSWVIYVNTLSEVQNISPLKAILNIVAAGIILGGILLLIAYIGALAGHQTAAIIWGTI
jgi:hypothetical protein